MKITGHIAITEFLKTPRYCGALIYGANYGLISAFMQKIKSSLNFRCQNLDYGYLKKNPEVLSNTLLEGSLFGGDSLIIVRDMSDNESLPKQIKTILDAHASISTPARKERNGNYVLFIGESLNSASPLRLFFEKSDSYATIACYTDTETVTEGVIKQWLQKNNISGDPKLLLPIFLGCDRILINSELDKVLLFFGNDSPSIETIVDLLGSIFSADPSRDSINNLCFSMLEGKCSYDEFNDALSIGDCGFISRAIIGYLMRLLNVQQQVQCGVDKKSAMFKVKPPILFKFQDKFLHHVSSVNSQRVMEIISELAYFEAKRVNTSTEGHISLLWKILSARNITV